MNFHNFNTLIFQHLYIYNSTFYGEIQKLSVLKIENTEIENLTAAINYLFLVKHISQEIIFNSIKFSGSKTIGSSWNIIDAPFVTLKNSIIQDC